jgi:hypothetical protein
VPRRLLLLNVLLAGVCLFCVAFVVHQLVSAPPAAEPARPAAPSGGPVVGAPPTSRPAVSAYNIIASRNLFSPSRSESPMAAAGPAIVGSKPNLYGVVLRETNPIAYLEDPLTKRVAGYRIGDAIAGGTVKVISADHVVITRSDGNLDVRLRDPSKPRPAPPAPGQPATPGQLPGHLPVPGMPPPAAMPPVPQQGVIPPRFMTPQQGAPQGQGPQYNPLMPSRRPSPSLGNRLPLPSASDAIQQPPQPQQ